VNTWDQFISPDELADTISYYNAQVGESRHVTASTAVEVAQQACNYYSYLEDDERADAIRYDVQSFAEYATTAFNVVDDLEFSPRYLPLLSSGHPYSESQDKESLAEWLGGAPEVSDSAKDAIIASLSPDVDEVTLLHANTRLILMAKRGQLSEQTMFLLEKALTA
jgi:hypothetical protein